MSFRWSAVSLRTVPSCSHNLFFSGKSAPSLAISTFAFTFLFQCLLFAFMFFPLHFPSLYFPSLYFPSSFSLSPAVCFLPLCIPLPPPVLYSLASFSNPRRVSRLKALSGGYRPVVSLGTIGSALALGNSLTSSLPFLCSPSVVFPRLSLSSLLLISPLKCFTKHGVNLPHSTQTSLMAVAWKRAEELVWGRRLGLMRPLGANRKDESCSWYILLGSADISLCLLLFFFFADYMNPRLDRRLASFW